MALRKACTVAVLATAAVFAAALSAASPAGAAATGAPPATAALRAASGVARAVPTPAEYKWSADRCNYGQRYCLTPRNGATPDRTAFMCTICIESCSKAADMARRLVWPRHQLRHSIDATACRIAPHAVWPR